MLRVPVELYLQVAPPPVLALWLFAGVLYAFIIRDIAEEVRGE